MSFSSRRARPCSSRSTSFHLHRQSPGSITGSWPRASPTTPTLLFFRHLNLLFSLVSYYVMLWFYSVTCFCCSLLNPIRLGLRLFIHEMVFFFSFFWFLFENLYSTVTLYPNLHGFFGSLFRCLFGVFKLLLVVFIILRRDNNLLGLHSQTYAIFTNFEEFEVCLV